MAPTSVSSWREERRFALTLMTPSDVAQVLGVKAKTLANWRVAGTGPQFVKVGGLVRYRRSTIEAWLVAQERSSTTVPR